MNDDNIMITREFIHTLGNDLVVLNSAILILSKNTNLDEKATKRVDQLVSKSKGITNLLREFRGQIEANERNLKRA